MIALAVSLCLLGAGALSLPASSQLYKWTDDKGVIHYTDKAPEKREAKAVEVKINSYSGPATVSTISTPAAGAAAKPKVPGPEGPGRADHPRRRPEDERLRPGPAGRNAAHSRLLNFKHQIPNKF